MNAEFAKCLLGGRMPDIYHSTFRIPHLLSCRSTNKLEISLIWKEE